MLKHSYVGMMRCVAFGAIGAFLLEGCAGHREAELATPIVPPPTMEPPQPADNVPPPAPPIDPPPAPPKNEAVGTASWYGPGFYGKTMANGEPYDASQMVAAHKTLELGKRVKVTRLDTGKSVDVTITDRGPHVDGRLIDLSEAAATALDIEEDGLAEVKIEWEE